MFGDSFFTLRFQCSQRKETCVFVPMFGDSFFTPPKRGILPRHLLWCFRPHVWGFFFHNQFIKNQRRTKSWFSSPCLGILFSHVCFGLTQEMIFSCFRPHVWGFFFHTVKAMRPYSGGAKIVFVPMFGDSFFTQQAWDAPRGGLSMALLRRGFPIDWNSHYFHPLTFCFLRFHAHRRGFSKYK